MTASISDPVGLNVGFIGLGLMGRPIAACIRSHGHKLITVARHSQVARDAGYETVATPAELVHRCDVVLTCLPTPASCLEVYTGASGLLAGARTGVTLIELSTIDLTTAGSIAQECVDHAVPWLDAPVSGGPMAAESGSLSIMVGGDAAELERQRPLLAAFGTKIFHMGGNGAGTAAKICNQMLTGVTHVLVAEAMALGAKLGLDAQRLYEVLRVSSGQSNSLDRAVPKFILPRKFDAAFAMNGICKDLDCVLRSGKDAGARLLLAPIALQMYEEARIAGLAKMDVASVFLTVERAAGLPGRGELSTPASGQPVSA